jgi:nuclear transport factor 2 (NTF2) superfamily protein
MSVTTEDAEITWEEAEAMLRRSEARFESGDVDGLVGRYDENIVIRYADLPPIHGRAAAERFMRARFARQRNYKLKKVLFSVCGQRIADTWTGTWEDVPTGRHMAGYGVEILELRGGKVIRWEAAFNVWEVGNEAAARYFDAT